VVLSIGKIAVALPLATSHSRTLPSRKSPPTSAASSSVQVSPAGRHYSIVKEPRADGRGSALRRWAISTGRLRGIRRAGNRSP
jgi:hypothetical protein